MHMCVCRRERAKLERERDALAHKCKVAEDDTEALKSQLQKVLHFRCGYLHF
jgi:hypothetical protein